MLLLTSIILRFSLLLISIRKSQEEGWGTGKFRVGSAVTEPYEDDNRAQVPYEKKKKKKANNFY
jgi:hypothetical protein